MNIVGTNKFGLNQIVRYIINGILATIVHYGVLTINIEIVGINSAGISNLVAAIFGITTSFFGSHYFVFPGSTARLSTLAIKFSGLYGFIAILHGIVLGLWTDWFGLDYRFGFAVATILQVSLSYFGNKFLVFAK